jgi:hypothetical protein
VIKRLTYTSIQVLLQHVSCFQDLVREEDILLDDPVIQAEEEMDRASTMVTKVYRKRKNDDVALTNAVIALSQSLQSENKEPADGKDRWDTFASLVAQKIRKLPTQMLRMEAEREIGDVLFHKEIQGLNDHVSTSNSG